MAVEARSSSTPRPKRKTPAERSAEFDALQARLKSEAAERRSKARRETGRIPRSR